MVRGFPLLACLVVIGVAPGAMAEGDGSMCEEGQTAGECYDHLNWSCHGVADTADPTSTSWTCVGITRDHRGDLRCIGYWRDATCWAGADPDSGDNELPAIEAIPLVPTDL